MTTPICRATESHRLLQLHHSKEAEFIALYGRRRVGKTFLIRQLFQNKGIYLEVVGTKDGSMNEQLENFSDALSKTFFDDIPLKTPKSWREAFDLLTQQTKKIPTSKKITIFLDELPWLASKRSKLLNNLDHYWNAHWVKSANIKLIVCGSAATWMLDNIINAKGGLHNRITEEMLLKPFNLAQTKEYLHSLNLKYSNKQVLDTYMVMGGVPYYLKQLQRSKSFSQNIQTICFNEDGTLYKEFDRLFKSLFDSDEVHQKIIRAISKKQHGISLEQLSKDTGISSGGRLSSRINELIKSGFLKKYLPYGKSANDFYLRIIDQYTLFYLKWIEDFYLRNESAPKNYWALSMKSGSYRSWAGYSFEMVCHQHTDQILSALDIDNVPCKVGYWRYVPSAASPRNGAQIDLLFDRDDDVITLCEIKYNSHIFTIDKNYARQLANKIQTFAAATKTKKQITLALITTGGLKTNIWTEELIDQTCELTDIID